VRAARAVLAAPRERPAGRDRRAATRLAAAAAAEGLGAAVGTAVGVGVAPPPAAARFEAASHSGARIAFETPGEPDAIPLDGGPHGPAAGPSPAEL
jgi:hypothetical protein